MLGPESTLNLRIPSHAQAYVCVNVYAFCFYMFYTIY